MNNIDEMKDMELDFKGKYLCVVFANKSNAEGVYISSPRFERHAGRIFLVGGFVAADNRFNSVPYAIAWERVDTYIVGESLQQLADLFARQEEIEDSIQGLTDARVK